MKFENFLSDLQRFDVPEDINLDGFTRTHTEQLARAAIWIAQEAAAFERKLGHSFDELNTLRRMWISVVRAQVGDVLRQRREEQETREQEESNAF